jgi:uncharacterized protein YkwD
MRTTRRRFRALLSAALPLLLAAVAPVLAAARSVVARRASAPCPGADLRPRPFAAAQVETATVCLINRIRVSHRLLRLDANRYLQRVAGAQVGHMVRWNYFADVRPSGQTPSRLIASTRYAAHAAGLATGQNIGWGTGDDTTPARIVAAWMQSPPHRAVILSPRFHDVGAAVASVLPTFLRRGEPGALYAAEFAARGR